MENFLSVLQRLLSLIKIVNSKFTITTLFNEIIPTRFRSSRKSNISRSKKEYEEKIFNGVHTTSFKRTHNKITHHNRLITGITDGVRCADLPFILNMSGIHLRAKERC